MGVTRDQVLEKLEQSRASLLAAVADIPEEVMQTQAVVEPWTVKDLLGHIAVWQQLAIQIIRD